MKIPKGWIRFECRDGGFALADVTTLFGVRSDGVHYWLLVGDVDFLVTKETAEEVVELVAKHRESR